MPADLINPTSTLTGKKPEMREVTNWYFALGHFRACLANGLSAQATTLLPGLCGKQYSRVPGATCNFVRKDQLEQLEAIQHKLPEYTTEREENKSSVLLPSAAWLTEKRHAGY